MSNPTIQPFTLGDQRHHQDYSHEIHMGMAAASSSPTMQQPPVPPSPTHAPSVAEAEPRKYVSEGEGCDNELSSSDKPKINPSMSEPKRGRGRPPGTGKRQRLANLVLGEWFSTSAGFAFATDMITVDAGEDIVLKVLSYSQQRPRVLHCMLCGTGTVSALTLRQTVSSVPTLSFQGHFDIVSLRGCYLVNEEGGPRSRTGGISVSLSRQGGYLFGGTVGTLIAASLVQVVACSFVYRSAKPKVIKQENGSKEDNTTKKDNSLETPTNEPSLPPATESAAEAAQTATRLSSPGWAGPGGGK